VESIKLGGLVTVAVGVGVMVFFFFVDHDTREIGVSLGSVPLLVGASLLLYAYALAPKHAE
jgi:Na+/phosphate symporter